MMTVSNSPVFEIGSWFGVGMLHWDTQELLVIYFREVVQSGSTMSSSHVQQPDSIKIILLDTYTN